MPSATSGESSKPRKGKRTFRGIAAKIFWRVSVSFSLQFADRVIELKLTQSAALLPLARLLEVFV